jgi:hypothetical protein
MESQLKSLKLSQMVERKMSKVFLVKFLELSELLRKRSANPRRAKSKKLLNNNSNPTISWEIYSEIWRICTVIWKRALKECGNQ